MSSKHSNLVNCVSEFLFRAWFLCYHQKTGNSLAFGRFEIRSYRSYIELIMKYGMDAKAMFTPKYHLGPGP